MGVSIEDLCDGLVLPEDLRENISKKRTTKELLLLIKNIPDLEFPDTNLLAGRLYIYANIKLCPKNVSEYLVVLDGLLNKTQKKFMIKHEKILDLILENTYERNFDYDLISAVKIIDYSLKLSHGDFPVETPCQTFLRIAIQLYYNSDIDTVQNVYYSMLRKTYVHATPTMNNAGTKKNQMSSCFLMGAGDDISSLMETNTEIAKISQLQGATGVCLSRVRHSSIANQGESNGVLPFAAIYDKTVECVDQGGKRRGASTFTLAMFHIDIEDFIDTRNTNNTNGIRFYQANTALFIPELFMERVRNNEKWSLFCPKRAKIIEGGKEVSIFGQYGRDFVRIYKKLEEEAVKRKQQYEMFLKEMDIVDAYVNENPEDKEKVELFFKMHKESHRLNKNLIVFKVVNAQDLYKKFCDMQVNSGMPYVLYSDTTNYKSNVKNIGTVDCMNLCLEITLPSDPETIASCNLGHISLKAMVKKKLTSLPFVHSDKLNRHYVNTRSMGGFGCFVGLEETKYKRVYSSKDLSECYDFGLLEETTRQLVRNITQVIKYNYYPLDEVDSEGRVLKRGKISKPNFQNKPLGIGVSGLGDAFALLDIYFESPEAILLNKMIFACMYYSALDESHKICLEGEGPYANFNKGTSEFFLNGEWTTMKGSPFANGFLQFDLWQQEAEECISRGKLNTQKYFVEDNVPIEPKEWGGRGSWSILKEKIKRDGVANSMLLALMPTASSAQVFNNTESFEAHQNLIYSRKLTTGNFTCYPSYFVYEMIEYDLWNKEMIEFIMIEGGTIKNIETLVFNRQETFAKFLSKYSENEAKEILTHLKNKYKCMFDISQQVCMQMARQRGIYIDHSQSLNIFIADPSIRKLGMVHDYGEALKLKTGMYYLRQRPPVVNDQFTVNSEFKKFYNENLKNQPSVCYMKEGCAHCE